MRTELPLLACGSAVLVEDLERVLDVEFSDRDEDTVAAVVLSELGRSARPGDVVNLSPLELTVVEVVGNRTRSLVVTMDGSTTGDADSH